jgi:formamidopyrimidine-DNA glycosylase
LPELPEVEITRRHLEAAMVGRAIVRATIGHPRTARFNASPAEVESRLTGRWVRSLGRHGKFLVADLDEGYTMVAHLGMSGRFTLTTSDVEQVAHTHLVALLDDGTEIRFVDPRTFGFIAVFDEDEVADSALSRLGPDAWETPPSPEDLATRLAARTAPIKALLLDQGPLAGLGNIYADEVLHRARIHPLTPGGDLDVGQLGALLSAIADVLAVAIESGGTTLDDLAYLLPDGTAGENLGRLAVYGRIDQPCPVCGTPVERIVVRQRSSHFCPKCQV